MDRFEALRSILLALVRAASLVARLIVSRILLGDTMVPNIEKDYI